MVSTINLGNFWDLNQIWNFSHFGIPPLPVRGFAICKYHPLRPLEGGWFPVTLERPHVPRRSSAKLIKRWAEPGGSLETRVKYPGMSNVYLDLDPPRGAKWMVKGATKQPPLGFKHHPLEGAGRLKHVKTPVFWRTSKYTCTYGRMQKHQAQLHV